MDHLQLCGVHCLQRPPPVAEGRIEGRSRCPWQIWGGRVRDEAVADQSRAEPPPPTLQLEEMISAACPPP
eukprot:14847689-Heterocapsa_arctica.AAC.1